MHTRNPAACLTLHVAASVCQQDTQRRQCVQHHNTMPTVQCGNVTTTRGTSPTQAAAAISNSSQLTPTVRPLHAPSATGSSKHGGGERVSALPADSAQAAADVGEVTVAAVLGSPMVTRLGRPPPADSWNRPRGGRPASVVVVWRTGGRRVCPITCSPIRVPAH